MKSTDSLINPMPKIMIKLHIMIFVLVNKEFEFFLDLGRVG